MRGVGVACIEYCENQGGDYHSAEGGEYREDGSLNGSEPSDAHLTLDLKAYGEKEDGHQGVVHPFQERHLEAEAAELQASFHVPYLQHGLQGRNIGEYERDHRTDQKEDASRGFIFPKFLGVLYRPPVFISKFFD